MMGRVFEKLDLRRKIMVLRVLIIIAYALIITSGTYAYLQVGDSKNTLSGQGECADGILYQGTEIYHTNLSVTNNYLEGAKGTITLQKNENCRIYGYAEIYLQTSSAVVSGTDDMLLSYAVTDGSNIISMGRFVPDTNNDQPLAYIELTTTSTTYNVYLWVEHTDLNDDRYFDDATYSGAIYATSRQSSSVGSLAVGDYVSYTSSKSSATATTTYTGYSTDQVINPKELTVWRVLRIYPDGSADIVSQYTSSAVIYFEGLTGYRNFTYQLNLLASQYENPSYTKGSRYFGYNGQTEQLTMENVPSATYFNTSPPWQCSTGNICPDSNTSEEALGGGDKFFWTDFNLTNNVLGTKVANKVGTSTATAYWTASRFYRYDSDTTYHWMVDYVKASGELVGNYLYHYYDNTLSSKAYGFALRPIVTLNSGLTFTGDGTSSSPKVIS